VTITAILDQAAIRAAQGVTRRRLFKRAGAGALALALGTTLGKRVTPAALAKGTSTSPCGPSPICPSSFCSGGNCLGSAGCARRYYNTFTCTSSNVNCWAEDYCSLGRGYWTCCDCCCTGGTGSTCTNCTGRRACICRQQISGAC
jgi:hypothetical protein